MSNTLRQVVAFAPTRRSRVDVLPVTIRCQLFSKLVLLLLATGLYTSDLPKAMATENLKNTPESRKAFELDAEGVKLLEEGRPDLALLRMEESHRIYELIISGDHANVAASLSNVAYCLQILGRPAEALAKLEESLAMRKRLLPEDRLEISKCLEGVAVCLVQLGRPDEAIPKFEEALAMSKSLSHGVGSDVARGLNNLAGCLDHLGRCAEALPRYEEALAIRKRIFPSDHPDVALSLNNLAHCLQALGRSAQALPMFEEALALRRRFGDHPDLATSLNNLAACLNDLGRSADALRYYEDALAMRKRLFRGDHPQVALSLSNVGSCLQSLGRSAEALPSFEEALAMRKRLFVDDHPDVANSLNNLAGCYDALGRSTAAISKFEEAVAVVRRLHSTAFHKYASNLASLKLQAGDAAGAVALLEDAIAETLHLREQAASLPEFERGQYFEEIRSGAFEVMVDAQVQLGRFDEALRYLEMGRARSILDLLSRAPFDPLDPVEKEAKAAQNAPLLSRIAAFRLQDRESRTRLSFLEHREAVLRSRPRPSDGDWNRQREELQHEQVGARVHQREVDADWHRLVAEALPETRPADVGALQELLVANERMLVYSVSDWKAFIFVVPPPGGTIRGYELAWPSVPVSPKLSPGSGAQPRSARAVNSASLTQAVDRYLASILRSGRSAQRRSLESALGKLEASAAPAVVVKRAELREALARLDQERDASVVEDPVAASARLGQPEELGHRLFEALIPDQVWSDIKDATLVYVVPHGALHRFPLESLIIRRGNGVTGSRYWLDAGPPLAYGPSGSTFVGSLKHRPIQGKQAHPYEVVALGDPVFVLPDNDSTIEALPERGALVLSAPPPSLVANDSLFRADVILRYDDQPIVDQKDLREAISLAANRLVSGTLSPASVPVEVWRAGRRRTVPVPAGKDLGIMVAGISSPEALASVQGGRFDPRIMEVERSRYLSRYGTLARLPGSRREVMSIFRNVTGRDYEEQRTGSVIGKPDSVRVLLDRDATETELFATAPLARFLHLATPGRADETDQAGFSSLALTLPAVSTLADNGFLSSLDLLKDWRNRLTGCEMVVLSACETQRGPWQRDEGVFALPLGFLYAGTSSVIASLWRVDDDSTAVLMGRLYAGLGDGNRNAGDGSVASNTRSRLAAFTAARKLLKTSYPEP